MEVLGAVASSIAVVQALAAGKHAVSLFREIPDIQKDFDYLMKELNMIKSMAQAVSRMAPTALEQDLINTAARNLNEVTAELEALLRICSREWPRGEQDEQGKEEKVACREKRHQEASTEDEPIQRNSSLCSELVARIQRYSISGRNETDYDEHANDAYKLAKSATSSSATTGNHRESSTSSTTSGRSYTGVRRSGYEQWS
ncbi:hypothetical protein BFJ66_g11882 [Fusarium oxysporum f. sp. cepae]|uniref:Fungal N-terminal domain-containing protein n=1 Tax=Fusarium oxysporum f. sp. cepae TaxID=396571 RepID=A0A3L6NZF3_FUSOX|nr:hypothetical protein BFJ65_g2856 [Fusarium oxysporum f. sp. cepae]RKK39654.1 hypothetical protein BFJ66_g11882 [Fusarium oxysporum f. sp. cepae]RKK41591.1 hypothetical protein BFJ67_g10447 [Fusarium oxysporum f. sp. cepae]